MRSRLILLLFASFCIFSSCNTDKTASDFLKYIPDEALTKYLLREYDIDFDGKISPEEAARVEGISSSNTKGNNTIRSLKGIEYFPNLKSIILYDHDIPKLKLDDLASLQYVTLQNCNTVEVSIKHCNSFNRLTIQGSDLKALQITGCPLEKLEVNWGLDKIDKFIIDDNIKLNTLTCPYDNLIELNTDLLVNVEDLQTSINKSRNIHLPYFKNLWGLTINLHDKDNYTFDPKFFPSLKYLSVYGEMKQITADGFPELISIGTSNNPELLQVTNCPSLERVGVYRVGEIVLTNLPALVKLDTGSSTIKKLHLTDLPNLVTLTVSHAGLEVLQFKGSFNIETLKLSYNKISTIDISGLKKLKILDLRNNPLEEVWVWEGFDYSVHKESFLVDDPNIFKIK